MHIRIDSEIIEGDLTTGSYLPMIDEGRREWYIAEDSEEAGKASRKYWEDMAENDPTEFACLVGAETLIQWGMGHSAGPGSTKVSSLTEWLDLHLDVPEEEFASYDSEEVNLEPPTVEERVQAATWDEETWDEKPETDLSELAAFVAGWDELCEELGYTPTVAYRHN